MVSPHHSANYKENMFLINTFGIIVILIYMQYVYYQPKAILFSPYDVQGTGTVKDKPNFNGQKEAEILRKAMKGIGNYESRLAFAW